jgi:Na+/glutamate symporter
MRCGKVGLMVYSRHSANSWVGCLPSTVLASRDASAMRLSKGIRKSVEIGLGAFTTGLFLLLVYGTLFFYFEVHHFKKYKREVQELDSGKRTPQEFIATQATKRNWYRSCEIVAWISDLCALIGLGALIAAVLNAAPA